MRPFVLSCTVAALLVGACADAESRSLADWVAGVKAEAMQKGVSAATVDAAMRGFKPNQRIIQLDRKQPEGSLSFAEYMERVVPTSRINQGRRLYQENKTLLDRIGNDIGVQPQFIVALWGIETNYGSNTGGFDIVPALATLAHDGRRADFFRDELMKALKIVDQGHVPLDEFMGSWAGAMGQCQFMPSSFIAYAVDYNGDGRKDIWNTQEDVFASIANYLHSVGWNASEGWGHRVTLPKGFNTSLASRDIKKPVSEWVSMGVRSAGDKPVQERSETLASIVFPGKEGQEAYMTFGNYDRIMKWNRSTYFATAVGTLADAIGR